MLYCISCFSYIGKTETLSEDQDHIISTRLAGRGRSVVRNRGQTHRVNRTHHGVQLELFSALPRLEHYVDQLMGVYGNDMRLFGYTYRLLDNKLYALCESYTQYGKCV